MAVIDSTSERIPASSAITTVTQVIFLAAALNGLEPSNSAYSKQSVGSTQAYAPQAYASGKNFSYIESTAEEIPASSRIAVATRVVVVAAALTNPEPSIDAHTQQSTMSNQAYAPENETFTIASSDRQDLITIARVRELGTYSENWKGEGSMPPKPSTLREAEGFARKLFKDGAVSAPHVGLSEDGEINFYWKSDLIVIDLGFEGDGTYSYFAEDNTGDRFYGDDEPLESPLPEAVMSKIIL